MKKFFDILGKQFFVINDFICRKIDKDKDGRKTNKQDRAVSVS